MTTRNVMARGQSGSVSHSAVLMNTIEVIWWPYGGDIRGRFYF